MPPPVHCCWVGETFPQVSAIVSKALSSRKEGLV